MRGLLKNIRFYVLLISLLFSLLLIRWAQVYIVGSALQLTRIEEIYGFAAILLLYVSLLIGPLYYQFPATPWKKQVTQARRALGVSSFYFALLHTCITFFKQLGGFNGLPYLSNRYLFSLSLGFAGLCILLLLALTSFDIVIEKMTFIRWKLLHRFVYLAGIVILLHVVLIGSHYGSVGTIISQITLYGVAALLLLEAPRIDNWLKKKVTLPSSGPTTVFIIALLIAYTVLSFLPSTAAVSLNIHSQHILLARDAVQNQFTTSNFPGLQGDKTLRYTVTFSHPDEVTPNTDTTLTFRAYNASTGSPVAFFKTPYEKPMHLVIVNNDLTYFSHIHPVQNNYDFTITTQFPTEGTYRLYLTFQPFGAIEQQDAFTISVGNAQQEQSANADFATKKIFGKYQVSLDTHGQLFANQLSFGEQKLTFTLLDAATQQPITTLQPYLAAFGHLVMIHTTTYDYLHVHPTNLAAPLPSQTAGPSVDFLPIGIYGPIKPGIYKIFAEFNPDGTLITTDFFVVVK